MYTAGGGFPWGLLIIAGIVYFLWSKGVFDGRRRFGNGHHYGGGYGSGYSPAQMPETPRAEQGGDAVFRGPRAVFDEWHQQAHETSGMPPHTQAPAAPTAPPAPPAAAAPESPVSGDSEPTR